MSKPRTKSAARAASKTPPAPALPVVTGPPPAALSPEVRQQVQALLARIERSTPALRAAGAFEVIGLMVQAGHALKLVTEHAFALERALGLEASPAAGASSPPHTNGVRA